MNRNQLFLTALVLSGVTAQTAFAAHSSKQVPSSPNRAAVSAHSQSRGAGAGKVSHTTPARSFSSAGNGNGKGSDKASRKNFTSDGSSKGAENTRPKNFHSLTNGSAEKSHIERPGKNDRDGDRQSHKEDHPDHVFKGEHGERGERERAEHERSERERHERPEHRYDERRYSYRGHDFDHRTYYEHGVEYHRFYQPYFYRGISFHVYAPGLYYAPAFYGWAYNLWAAPVAFNWGWAASPWYGYYGGWFRPYPVYASPSMWLTDYLVAQTLEAAYEARLHPAVEARSARADYSSSPMTPAVKQAIAEEVRRQIALENFEARNVSVNPPDPGSSGVARMLGDHTSHVFVLDARLDVASVNGTCSLGEGDVIQLAGPTALNATAANLVVLATKGSDCRKGAIVTIGLADLQEMQNHMRATIDQGLAELRSKQGKGLPAAPPSATKPPTQAEYAAIAPPSNPNGADKK
jgi:hypothetical protein